MYALVALLLSASVLALPRNLRIRDNAASTASATGSCPGAPALPVGAVPGDPCVGHNSTAANPPSVPPPSAREVAPRRRKTKRAGFSTCQTVTLDQYNASP